MANLNELMAIAVAADTPIINYRRLELTATPFGIYIKGARKWTGTAAKSVHKLYS